jgi:hypothetical protein
MCRQDMGHLTAWATDSRQILWRRAGGNRRSTAPRVRTRSLPENMAFRSDILSEARQKGAGDHEHTARAMSRHVMWHELRTRREENCATLSGGPRRFIRQTTVPLVKQAEAALKAYLKVRDALPEYDEVFIARNGTSMDQRTVRYRIHKYYKEAGIKKKASVHTLRHTFSTHQIHNGLKLNQLKEVLGHRRMETTYKYVHLDRTNLRAEMEQGAL